MAAWVLVNSIGIIASCVTAICVSNDIRIWLCTMEEERANVLKAEAVKVKAQLGP